MAALRQFREMQSPVETIIMRNVQVCSSDVGLSHFVLCIQTRCLFAPCIADEAASQNLNILPHDAFAILPSKPPKQPPRFRTGCKRGYSYNRVTGGRRTLLAAAAQTSQSELEVELFVDVKGPIKNIGKQVWDGLLQSHVSTSMYCTSGLSHKGR